MSPSDYRELTFASIIFCPQESDLEFVNLKSRITVHSPMSDFSYYTLYKLLQQAIKIGGDVVECGVFMGGSASFIANVMQDSGKKLHLFDTFCGLPQEGVSDNFHSQGNFAVDLEGKPIVFEEVVKVVGHPETTCFYKGVIPQTFSGLESLRICFAHIDVDLYRSVLDCCEFIYPRLSPGGFMVFDDYGQWSCLGARKAVDEFLEDKPEVVLPLLTNQGVVFKC